MSNAQLISFVLLWLVIVVEGVLLFLLYRHVGLIYGQQLQKLTGLMVGTQAPSFSATDVDGKSVSMEALLSNKPTLLIFGSLHCSSCRDLLLDQEVSRFLSSRSIPGYFLVSTAEVQDSNFKEHIRQPEKSLTIITTEEETFKKYAVPATPFAYVLDRGGKIATGSAVSGGVKQIKALYEQQTNGDNRTSVGETSVLAAGKLDES